jgi:hypothetical protein
MFYIIFIIRVSGEYDTARLLIYCSLDSGERREKSTFKLINLRWRIVSRRTTEQNETPANLNELLESPTANRVFAVEGDGVSETSKIIFVSRPRKENLEWIEHHTGSGTSSSIYYYQQRGFCLLGRRSSYRTRFRPPIEASKWKFLKVEIGQLCWKASMRLLLKIVCYVYIKLCKLISPWVILIFMGILRFPGHCDLSIFSLSSSRVPSCKHCLLFGHERQSSLLLWSEYQVDYLKKIGEFCRLSSGECRLLYLCSKYP